MGEKQEYNEERLAADEVEICSFRHIVFWPLVLGGEGLTELQEENAIASLIRQTAKAVRQEEGWEAVPDLADHVRNDPGEPSASKQGLHHPQSYAEIVYFHDFVQRSLFHKPKGEWPDEHAPVLLLRNEQLQRICVDPRGCDLPLEFEVGRLSLYLFTTGVAILVIELALSVPDEAELQPALADIQAFMDQFRRWHVPYWEGNKKPGLVAESITLSWSDGKKQTFPTNDPDLEETQRALLENCDRAVRPLRHWLEILPRAISSFLASATKQERQGHSLTHRMNDLHWRSISDERMHMMNFILVPPHKIDEIQESDWVRLCFADKPGKDWPYLICDGKWEQFRKEHVFDWFWQTCTRQLFSGFNHVIVSAACWFSENILVHHFRRHYFQMNLMALFEQASLLAFSSRISRATALRRREDDATFCESLIAIRRDFLHFVHEFRFTGVSNQMQARAMFDVMRRQMGLHELFNDVENELRTGTDYMLAIANHEQTETAGRLNVIVGVAAALGLVVGFASTHGIEIIQDKTFGEGKNWFVIFGTLIMLALLYTKPIANAMLGNSKKANAINNLNRLLNILIPLAIFIVIAGFIV